MKRRDLFSQIIRANAEVMRLTDKLVPRSCAACGRPFVSGAYQALYCSPQCRYRAQKRRQRASAKKKG